MTSFQDITLKNSSSPVIMIVRRAAEVRVEMTGVVSGFRQFCITIRPTNIRSHSTTSLCVCVCVCVGGRGGEEGWVAF